MNFELNALLDDEFSSKNTFSEPVKQVHIQRQQRNNRKCITTIEGLDADIDLKKILKAFKKKANTNGAIVDGSILSFQGDKRKELVEFLVTYKICEEKDIVVHGF